MFRTPLLQVASGRGGKYEGLKTRTATIHNPVSTRSHLVSLLSSFLPLSSLSPPPLTLPFFLPPHIYSPSFLSLPPHLTPSAMAPVTYLRRTRLPDPQHLSPKFPPQPPGGRTVGLSFPLLECTPALIAPKPRPPSCRHSNEGSTSHEVTAFSLPALGLADWWGTR